MKRIVSIVLALSLVFSMFYIVSAQSAVYVSPKGSDSNAGGINSPFATLSCAVASGAKEIILRGGIYNKGAELKSGTSITAYGDEKPIFSSGKSIDLSLMKPTQRTDSLVKGICEIKLSDAGIADFGDIHSVLSYNGKILPLASMPSVGYDGENKGLTLNESKDLGNGLSEINFTRIKGDTDIYNQNIIDKKTDVYVHGVFGAYDKEILAPVKATQERNIITNAYSDSLPCCPYKEVCGYDISRECYQLMNSFFFIDKAGEWYIDRDKGILYIMPLKNMTGTLSLITEKTCFVKADGASEIKVSGLSFTQSLDTAMDFNDCSDIAVERCNFSALSNGIKGEKCNKITVENSEFNSIGYSAIDLSGNENKISNNLITDTGCLVWTNTQAVKIDGNSSSITNNVINRNPHNGILITGGKNTVSYNEISNTCYRANGGGVAIDGGISGKDNTILYNWFHDITRATTSKSSSGAVVDASSIADAQLQGLPTGCASTVFLGYTTNGNIIKGNFAYNVATPIQMINAQNNTISGNVYVDANDGPSFDVHSNEIDSDKVPITLPKEILNSAKASNIDYTSNNGNTFSGNVFTGITVTTAPEFVISGNKLSDNITVTKDVMLKSYRNGDFTITQSAITKYMPSFEAIPQEKIGRKEVPAPTAITPQSIIKSSVVLLMNSNNAMVNGEKATTDTMPCILNGRALVPVRFIAESFGEKVGWNNASREITIGDKISLTVGKSSISIDGVESPIDVPAQIISERTFVPLRVISEALGKKVFWDDRGLIVINNDGQEFDSETGTEIIQAVK